MAWILPLLLSIAAILSPQHTTSSTPAMNGFSLELIDRDSIHSPLYPGNVNAAERIRHRAKASHIRSLWLKSRTIGSQEASIRPIITFDSYRYMVSLGIGQPQTDLKLLIDTGSDTTWTQSYPCTGCFPQVRPIYNPATSHTYHPLPCGHHLCVPYNCSNGVCQFSMSYGDGTWTKGSLATDDFSFSSRTDGVITIESIVFGCSRDSSGRMYPRTNTISGVLGLGGGMQSFVSQIGDRIQNRFSYCLLPWGHDGSSFLRFGSDIRVSKNAQSTPFLETDEPTFYFLNLIDISINGRRLNLPTGTFSRHPNRTGGCIIDSSSPTTLLVTTAYNAVEGTLKDYFRAHYLTLVNGTNYGLDLCYRMPRGFAAFPSMTLHFVGANMHLGTENLFELIHSDSVFCLTMGSDDHMTILGSAQQANIRFVYDIGRRQLTFAPENCYHN